MKTKKALLSALMFTVLSTSTIAVTAASAEAKWVCVKNARAYSLGQGSCEGWRYYR